MGNIYNSFSSWLTGKGLGGYLDSQGQLANGTSQAFFSREYTAWVKHVIKAYTADIIDHFGLPSNTKLTLVSINQNNPSGLPIIRGLTPAQVDYFFNGTSDFTWQTCGRKPVTHTRYYSNEFNVGGTGDTTPPAAPIVALANDTGSSGADLITSDGTLVVTPAEAGGTIQYSTDGGTTWTSSFTASEGSNTVQVRQVDAAGNNGTPASLTFTLDTTAPSAPAVALANDTGSDGGDGITNDGSLTVTPAEAGGTIEYSTDGGTTWTTSFTASEGSNTVQVRQVDAAGNNGAPASLTFTLDTLAPTAPGVALTNDTGNVGDGITSDGSLTVTPAEVGGTIEYSIDGGTTWTSSFTAVEGSNTVDVRQVDAAGNNGAPASLTFTLDQTSPAAPIVALANDTGSDGGDGITSDGSLTVIAAEGGGTIEYSTDGGTTWTSSFTASEGANTVQVRQVDDAGNNGTPASLTFTLDTLAPAAPGVALANDTGSDGGDGITSDGSLTVTPAEGGGAIEYSIDGGTTWNTSFSAIEGANTVDVRQVDAAGNNGAVGSLTFTLDTLAPAAPVVASFSTDSGVLGDGITNDNTPTVSGTAEANSRVEVFRTGFSIGTTTADGSGNWSFTDPANLVDNSYVYYAQATDAAGNVSAPSNGLGLGVDTQAPTDIRLNASSALIAALAGQSSNSNTAANTSTGAGTLMGTLSAVGGSTFSIASDPTSQFVLSGNQLSLATGQQIFESEAAFNLTIQVTDSAGNAYFETFRFLPGTNTGNTMNGNNSAGTGASLATAVTGDDVIMGFRGGDTLNISGSTILGSSGDDLVFGGNSNDMLRGGAGNDQLHGGFGNDTFYGDTGDDILSGGADADQFRFVAPSTNGLDTIQDFTVNQDFLVLFSNGDGWNTAGSSGGTALNSSDYNTRSSITGIQSGDDDEVVEISAAQTGVQIATGSGANANAYVLVFNSTTGFGELWHDTNWSDQANRVQIATFENITTLAGVTAFDNGDFMVWA